MLILAADTHIKSQLAYMGGAYLQLILVLENISLDKQHKMWTNAPDYSVAVNLQISVFISELFGL